VRRDVLNGKEVEAIDYSAHEEMANKEFHLIREEAFTKFELTCMHIYHSLGEVKAGEICLFVFVSSGHRKPAQEAIEWLVEAIKTRVPVFGKELFGDSSHVWKVNT
jgi:molybdopterin synthase catalytic subunit